MQLHHSDCKLSCNAQHWMDWRNHNIIMKKRVMETANILISAQFFFISLRCFLLITNSIYIQKRHARLLRHYTPKVICRHTNISTDGIWARPNDKLRREKNLSNYFHERRKSMETWDVRISYIYVHLPFPFEVDDIFSSCSFQSPLMLSHGTSCFQCTFAYLSL